MVHEGSPLKPQSPYSRTKYMMEMILEDYCHAYGMKGIALRYFNPIGADPKMRTGPYVKNPTHVLGRLVATSMGKFPYFEITGTTWPTRDGSGVRDYIHVWDLARAHVQAVENFDRAFSFPQPHLTSNPNNRVINLGTGRGVTVKEFVNAFERAHGKEIPKREAPPRPGDVAGSFASADTALKLIDWRAELSIDQGIKDALAWTASFISPQLQ